MNSVLPLLGLCAVVTSCLAAPTLNREEAAAVAEPSLVRTKRADEIIYDGQNNPRAKKSSDDELSPPVAATAEDATKTAAETQPAAKPAEVEDLERTETPGELKVEEKEVENTAEEMGEPTDVVAGPETEEEQQTTTENENENGAETSNPTAEEEDEQPLEERRRREATHSRQQRSAAKTMMVAENMAAPGDQKLRAKRDLDADELRELFDAQRAPPSEYDGQDYEEAEEVPVEELEDGGEDLEQEQEPEPEQQPLPWRYYDLGRPKRRDFDRALSDAVLEEEAEREAVRELLAERAAEEAREALLSYLVGGRPKSEVEPYVDEEQTDDDGELDRFEEDGNDDAAEEEEERGEGDSSEEESEEEGLELVPSDGEDDEFFGGRRINEVERFGDEEAQAVPDEVVAAEKRLEYPYSYEPYGGRWGALVPGSKRSDRDPYDRLYRLAEALSGPSIGLPAADDSGSNAEYVK